MDKELLRKYLNDDGFKAVGVIYGNKRIILESDIHVDYEHEVIIYPMKNSTRIIPFNAISYLDLLDKNDQYINYFKEV
ncbi:hypothetical protein WL766_06670 [Staphylococcus pasteuri]|uniref:hypothetical protein n=1 Tax=Staphylococcus TaxID=1279 RepID=UPI00086BF7E3|nr:MULTISPECIES: hypothetical protein [Staphylococcus]ODB38430.1 hypothetical protein A9N02_11935 [Staphylococcus sp. AOAB]RQX27004.1 hypothetical protein DB792_09130 [Staphylococcus warneri]MCO0861800.1 hypothetical protein [Staphylococcus pasteuri]MCO5360623.1 hypothetical protein [Staphylococcus pasteuri]OFV09631.1 hypothetical protein HMPREF3125_05295 [Staphylococcus sp. HMSC13A10]